MEYKVIAFVPSINRNKGTLDDVAEQLENLIKEYNHQGWQYVRLETVTTFVPADPGCFGLGSKPAYTLIREMAVFSMAE